MRNKLFFKKKNRNLWFDLQRLRQRQLVLYCYEYFVCICVQMYVWMDRQSFDFYHFTSMKMSNLLHINIHSFENENSTLNFWHTGNGNAAYAKKFSVEGLNHHNINVFYEEEKMAKTIEKEAQNFRLITNFRPLQIQLSFLHVVIMIWCVYVCVSKGFLTMKKGKTEIAIYNENIHKHSKKRYFMLIIGKM